MKLIATEIARLGRSFAVDVSGGRYKLESRPGCTWRETSTEVELLYLMEDQTIKSLDMHEEETETI